MPPDALTTAPPICVYAASSDAIEASFYEAATALGAAMAQRGHALVYGGGSIGLMGAVCRAVHAHGGHMVGVIPERLRLREVCYEDADELIVTQTMAERKTILAARGEAYIALPGGFGTLEELAEILVLKQLHYHDKAIVLLNTNDFWAPLVALFEHFYDNGFARRLDASMYTIVDTPEAALDYIAAYRPSPRTAKWVR